MGQSVKAAIAASLITGMAVFAFAADGEGKPRGKGDKGGPKGGEGRPAPEEIFKRIDANNDGKISLDEFLAAPAPQRRDGQGGPKEGPKDGQRKGKGEGDKGGPKGGEGDRPQPPPREEIFKHIDTNGDGFISLEEFKNAPRPEGRGPGGPGGEGGRKGGKGGPGGKGDSGDKPKRPPLEGDAK